MQIPKMHEKMEKIFVALKIIPCEAAVVNYSYEHALLKSEISIKMTFSNGR